MRLGEARERVVVKRNGSRRSYFVEEDMERKFVAVFVPSTGSPKGRVGSNPLKTLKKYQFSEPAGKPGSVADNHSSGMPVTRHLKRPTRPQCGSHLLACAKGGLFGLAPNGVYHAADCYQPRGALLPHPFTLTCASEEAIGGLLSAALSVGSRPPGVTWRPTLWSPDFPPSHRPKAARQRLPG